MSGCCEHGNEPSGNLKAHRSLALNQGHPTFSGEGPQPLLWHGSHTGGVKITTNIPSYLYCAISTVYVHNLQMWPRAVDAYVSTKHNCGRFINESTTPFQCVK
jgi:hypothetical protein